jgi:uncharacterized membrane protein YGL010W
MDAHPSRAFGVSFFSAMLGPYSSEQWVARYERSHQHPVNRLCHTYGIPTILVSLFVFLAGFFYHRLWILALVLFAIGWMLQFVGHAFEGKPPEFFHDWRFLFVGVRWWWAKINGKASAESELNSISGDSR